MPRPNAHPILQFLPWLAAGLLAAALPATAGEVHQWKDARGVTHYSDSPPPNQTHKSRTISQKGTATIAAAAAGPVVANADCSNARSNLKVLQGDTEVGLDEDKDGKAERPLTPKERADRIQQAQANIKTYCEVDLASEP